MQTVLILGDWSKDGHGQTQNYIVDHNLESSAALNQAHVKGCQILGIDFEENVADSYEEPYISEDDLEALIEHKIIEEVPEVDKTKVYQKGNTYWRLAVPTQFSYVDWISEDGSKGAIDESLYAALWMAIAQLGEPTLVYTQVNKDRTNELKIGGYGLFS